MNSEEKLYPEIESWLQSYLKDKYKGCSVQTTYQTSRQFLDIFLKKYGVTCNNALGLKIKIDIVGILRNKDKTEFVFVEVKDSDVTLKDLGQLWGYTQLIDPIESFLVTSKEIGRISKLFNLERRYDLLHYGQKRNKSMRIAKWDTIRKSISWESIIPKA